MLRSTDLKKEFPHLKIFINGGLNTISDCVEQMKFVDCVMVGIAIQSNPFFLENVDNVFYGKKIQSTNKDAKTGKVKKMTTPCKKTKYFSNNSNCT